MNLNKLLNNNKKKLTATITNYKLKNRPFNTYYFDHLIRYIISLDIVKENKDFFKYFYLNTYTRTTLPFFPSSNQYQYQFNREIPHLSYVSS